MTEKPLHPQQSFEFDEFDEWAPDYDGEVSHAGGFPFEGYSDILQTIFNWADAAPGMHVLDLGTGTGNLALLFEAAGCKVMGIDFSAEMLKAARQKIPGAAFFQLDIRQPWLPLQGQRFDRIISGYVFHHFPLSEKVKLLNTCAQLLNTGGWLVMGDISFRSVEHLEQARVQYQQCWEEEHYWIAAQTAEALTELGWLCDYKQVSNCGGVYRLKRSQQNHD